MSVRFQCNSLALDDSKSVVAKSIYNVVCPWYESVNVEQNM